MSARHTHTLRGNCLVSDWATNLSCTFVELVVAHCVFCSGQNATLVHQQHRKLSNQPRDGDFEIFLTKHLD